ncbi:MAG: ABC transporter permease [Anaerolineae bacterium]|jgi:ABC-type polysaccharide/polyol phosphate export permease
MTILNRLRELWQYRGLIRNLVTRDLKVRYRNSILGIVWSWANPLLMMLVFTVVFNFLFTRSDLPHYHVFLLCALLPWQFFSQAVSEATNSIVGNAHLIKKVYFPREVLPISVVLSNLLNFIIALPVFFGLALVSGATITPWALLLPIPILIQVAFSLGLCMILATLNVFYRDTRIILSVLIQAWFFLTPVFYPITQIGQEKTLLGVTFDAQLWLRRLNPMASVIASYRDLLYRGTYTGLDFLLRTAFTSLIILAIGYVIFLRYSPRFGEEV